MYALSTLLKAPEEGRCCPTISTVHQNRNLHPEHLRTPAQCHQWAQPHQAHLTPAHLQQQPQRLPLCTRCCILSACPAPGVVTPREPPPGTQHRAAQAALPASPAAARLHPPLPASSQVTALASSGRPPEPPRSHGRGRVPTTTPFCRLGARRRNL